MKLALGAATLAASVAGVPLSVRSAVCASVGFGSPITNPIGSFPDWAIKARVADATLYMQDGGQVLDYQSALNFTALQQENVNVIELDTDFSGYADNATFAGYVSNVQGVSKIAHNAGMKVVVYYPAGEVITDAVYVKTNQSMAKQHPTWVQVDLDGKTKNTFLGSGQVFWVPPGAESAWMDFNSGWRDVFANRVAQIAAAGADGVWVDVPLYNDILGLWTDSSPDAVAQFKADTGRTIPKSLNYANEDFRAWLKWRHDNINNFLKYSCNKAKAVNPAFLCIIETVTMDYLYASRAGLDGASLIDPSISHVWEVDVVSLDNSMRTALEDDWISYIGMYKYSHSASAPYPAWTFTYGAKEDDARHSIVVSLAAGNNIYEVKSPRKEESTDVNMRTHMYSWIQANEDRLYRAKRIARVAVFHSSETRDYVDSADQGNGLFCTYQPKVADTTWWSQDASNTCYIFQWLGEYRGVIKALVHSHIPFETLVSPRLSLVNLTQYDTIILPNTQSLTDAQATTLNAFVQQGGNLIVTGPNPSLLNDVGTIRSELALSTVLGFGKASIPASKYNQVSGGGVVSYTQSNVGWKYLNTTDPVALQTLIANNAALLPTFVTSNASRKVQFEVSYLAEWNQVLIHMVSFAAIDGKYTPTKVSFQVNIDLALLGQKFIKSNSTVSAVSIISPDTSFACQSSLTDGLIPAYTISGNNLTVPVVDLEQYQIIVLNVGAGPTAPPTSATTKTLAVQPTTASVPPPACKTYYTVNGDSCNDIVSYYSDTGLTIAILQQLNPGVCTQPANVLADGVKVCIAAATVVSSTSTTVKATTSTAPTSTVTKATSSTTTSSKATSSSIAASSSTTKATSTTVTASKTSTTASTCKSFYTTNGDSCNDIVSYYSDSGLTLAKLQTLNPGLCTKPATVLADGIKVCIA